MAFRVEVESSKEMLWVHDREGLRAFIYGVGIQAGRTFVQTYDVIDTVIEHLRLNGIASLDVNGKEYTISGS